MARSNGVKAIAHFGLKGRAMIAQDSVLGKKDNAEIALKGNAVKDS
jgi:hypothetical protein